MASSMAYSVTKAAALHLMKHLAFTQGPKIRVNAVLPGLLLTDWVRSITSHQLIDMLRLYRVRSTAKQ
jgi:NAD(P)-dependent dehydrogenase (short-subunit alcohol dehydrogenase family)